MKNINMIPAIPGTVGAIMSRQPLELSPRMRAREALAACARWVCPRIL